MMEYSDEQEKVLEDGDWVDTHHFADDKVVENVREMTLDGSTENDGGESKDDTKSDDDNQEAVDMEDFIDSGMLEEEAEDTSRKEIHKPKVN